MDEAYQFTDAQLVQLRRYCGFPTMGNSVGKATDGVLTNVYGQLEYRLSTTTVEEATSYILPSLIILQKLEDAILAAACNLRADQIAIWKRNQTEIQERNALYNRRRKDLCDYLGVGYGPALIRQSNGSRSWVV